MATKLTKAELEAEAAKLQQELLKEREGRNADIRSLSDQLRIVMAERDRHATGTSLLDARAKIINTQERLAEAQERQRETSVANRELGTRVARQAGDLKVAGLERQVAVLELDNANLRHEKAIRLLDQENGRLRLRIGELVARAEDPDKALTLTNGEVLSIEHLTYNGRWQLDGFHQLGNDRSIEIKLVRVGDCDTGAGA